MFFYSFALPCYYVIVVAADVVIVVLAAAVFIVVSDDEFKRVRAVNKKMHSVHTQSSAK